MDYKLLLIANWKRHRGSLIGVFILILTVSLAFSTVLTVWANSGRYMESELDRAGFGDITVWTADGSGSVPVLRSLADRIEALSAVSKVESQSLIYSNYTINGKESDSEGQMILFDSAENRYRFFTDDLSSYQGTVPAIHSGEVYVSPSLISMFGVQIGETVRFSVARQGGTVELTVKGFYEDPFMGSSMIGMKGFLICETDYLDILQLIRDSGIDALAEGGAMLHIFAADSGTASLTELNSLINETAGLSNYSRFVHSRIAISAFMLILQNAFCGLLLAFVLVLLFAAAAVLGHSIGSAIDADHVNLGVLNAVGFTAKKLRTIQLIQYLAVILGAVVTGLLLSVPLSRFINRATLTSTGLLIPSALPWGRCLLSFAAVIALLTGFIVLKTGRIGRITPMRAIRGGTDSEYQSAHLPAITGRFLSLSLAFRQLFSGKRRYAGACAVAAFLVFFASLAGRMDSWLGPDGKGMMDAFNPADLDIGIQAIGDLTSEDWKETVLASTDITGSYLLAMPGVSVNGIDYTANVITEPERFHILEGRTCRAVNEIVITESAAADLGVSPGSTLTVRADSGTADYVVAGIYQCANDMGANIGMNREGYLLIGKDDPRLWCHHLFLSDTSQKAQIQETLKSSFGSGIHVHENTWPGLSGIISAMRALMVFLYGSIVLFILIVTAMTASRLLAAERKELGIYRAIGFPIRRLRLTFALRFGLTAVLGSAAGTALASLFTDPLVSAVMKYAGISNFSSNPGAAAVLFPAFAVILLFTAFAWLAAGRMKQSDLTVLIGE